MTFLCDVHISFKVVNHLLSIGYEALHVNDILNGSETKDAEIAEYADTHDLIVITKDADFRDSHFVNKTPKKLIKVNLGNISNQELIQLLSLNVTAIDKLNAKTGFLLELNKEHSTFIEME